MSMKAKARVSPENYLSPFGDSNHAETPMGSGNKETGKFARHSARMQPLLPRYNKLGSGEISASGHKLETILKLNEEPWEAEVFKEEILKLKLNQLYLVSKDLNGMGFNELHQLESEMLEVLKCVKISKLRIETEVSKEKILQLKLKQLQLLLKDLTGMGFYELHQVEHEVNKCLMSVWTWKDNLRREIMDKPKVMKDRAVLPIQNFHTKVQGRRGSHLSTDVPPPICFKYYPEEKKERPANKDKADGDAEKGYKDKASYLWHYSLMVLLICVWFLVVCLAMVMR